MLKYNSYLERTFTSRSCVSSTSSPWLTVSVLLAINFSIRLIILFNTTNFNFSDYAVYIGGLERLINGENQYLLQENYLFAISHIAFFLSRIGDPIITFLFLNCILGTLTSYIIFSLVTEITGNNTAGIIALIVLTIYTEFMVFSSVFYTPVIMLFLVSMLMYLINKYINSSKRSIVLIAFPAIILIFCLTFLFKPELKYFPFFLVIPTTWMICRNKPTALRLAALIPVMIVSQFVMTSPLILTRPPGNIIANDFVFFGHTDYGGDGGEGAFVYPENEARYNEKWNRYIEENSIVNPGRKDRNRFQSLEIRDFIVEHPGKWIKLQLTKFFRTFGVVPESTSFRVLFTGLLKEKLWITALVVAAPVALIILAFIATFKSDNYKKFADNTFIPVYITFFAYYIIATILYGHYQERYRLPLMVMFIVPLLSVSLAFVMKGYFFSGRSMVAKTILIMLFIAVWSVQTHNTMNNKGRMDNLLQELGKIKSKDT